MAKDNAGVGAGKKSFRCRLCNRAIRVPRGWTIGPAARRHYWRKHREVMQPSPRKKS